MLRTIWNMIIGLVVLIAALSFFYGNDTSVDTDKIDEYRQIATSIGLDFDREYGYREYADIKRTNQLGVAGEYEFFQIGDEVESIYFANKNVTVVRRIRHAEPYSYVKLLRLAKGRVPDLHLC
ncbi:hypothetical protein [Candidatus Vondammii sp. HM_W22]|uniref:hypothetical protein n=1 Tax=Candidatus Vondammii sp. HM_W22 TaxID=2687299 RepID=UPI001F14455B|nr:hypothetical protein [Candidatus Vondammii sp. HM_W22]